jgi:hypothetical protein
MSDTKNLAIFSGERKDWQTWKKHRRQRAADIMRDRSTEDRERRQAKSQKRDVATSFDDRKL